MNIADPQAFTEIALRLGAATLAGGILGADRDLKEKPAGMRTLALVSLGSALVVLVGVPDLAHPTSVDNPAARIIQGVFAGIGFLGGGVILHRKAENMISGLTTAATIWIAAGLGVVCALGLWIPLFVAVVLALFVLIPGMWIEHLVVTRFRPPSPPGDTKPPPADNR